MEVTISELIELVRPGETVVVEYETSYVPEFALKLLADYTRENGVPFFIDDNFDSLYTVLVHCKMLGLDVDLSHAHVFKTGGRREVGGKVTRVEFHPDPRVLLRNYDRVFSEAVGTLEKPALNLVLGVESLLYFVRDVRDFYRFLLGIQRYVGNRGRKSFYLIHIGLISSLPAYVRPELRRIATSVWVFNSYPTGVKLSILRSPDLDLVGREFTIDVGGVFRGGS
ncbi:DUF257 family protein [Thermococcus sp.]|uniref:DUF257 family protein n=1 Tax=Thermococcus sp. TaxID=35749 RepID=UPI00262B59A0|nr:DUF257 family protein [Thermococcus sp.]